MMQIAGLRATFVGLAMVATLTVPATAATGRYTTSSGTVLDTKTKLTWQQSIAPTSMTWEAAKSYCAGLGSTLGGGAWRLPTIKELQTLVDISLSSGPTIDATAFPNTRASGVWSSTPATATSGVAWILAFNNGGEGQA